MSVSLKDFNREELKLMRNACTTLLEYYTNSIGCIGYYKCKYTCALCDFTDDPNLNVVGRISTSILSLCELCPWMIFENTKCFRWLSSNFPVLDYSFGISGTRARRDPEFIAARAPMLNMWIQQIDEEIEKHENLERNRPESEHRTGPMAC